MWDSYIFFVSNERRKRQLDYRLSYTTRETWKVVDFVQVVQFVEIVDISFTDIQYGKPR